MDTSFPEPGYAPPAAKPVAKRPMARSAVVGAIVGGLAWIAISELGVPAIFHVPGTGGLIAAVLLGGLLNMSRWRAVLWVGAALLVLLFPVIWYTPAVVKPAKALVRADPVPPPPLTLDAIVVLSSGLNAEGLVDLQGLERLVAGLELAKATNTTEFVTTRVRSASDPEVMTDRDQRRLVALSGMRLRHFIVHDVSSTRDEAMATAQLARSERWGRVAVVTSPLHSRRACGAFERSGLRVTCVPAAARDYSLSKLASPGDRLEVFRLWMYELAGTTQYRLRGWLP